MAAATEAVSRAAHVAGAAATCQPYSMHTLCMPLNAHRPLPRQLANAKNTRR